MDNTFLLDDFIRSGEKLPGTKQLYECNGAKKFRVSIEVVGKIQILIEDHQDLYISQRRFAKPPFPQCYVEIDKSDGGRFGIVQNKDRLFFLVHNIDNELGGISPATILLTPEGLYVQPLHKGAKEVSQKEKDTILALAGFVETLWLLMHQPGVIKTTGVPSKQKVIRGKLRAVRAHSVLTIDLGAKDVVNRIAQIGSRGSGVREHQVRGTWVHLKRDFGCPAHDWQEVVRPVWEPETYECPLCGTRRLWREDHVRGEHERGNVFHTYEVTDSRLKKKGPKRDKYAPRKPSGPYLGDPIPPSGGGSDHPAHP